MLLSFQGEFSLPCGCCLQKLIFLFQFYVCGFPNDNPQRVRRFAVGKTRFMIMLLTAHFTRIAVGDCRDGILFYSYHEVYEIVDCVLHASTILFQFILMKLL